MFEFFPLALFQFLPVRHELVEEMVDDVRLEDFDTERIGKFLGIFFDLHVKSQYSGVSERRKGRAWSGACLKSKTSNLC